MTVSSAFCEMDKANNLPGIHILYLDLVFEVTLCGQDVDADGGQARCQCNQRNRNPQTFNE
ncbi:MAG: hypothetical protein IPJ18_16140 [Betaproteobacteria bacterium]|nr:hypothetical protein [Betaproteobacteria bacterium]